MAIEITVTINNVHSIDLRVRQISAVGYLIGLKGESIVDNHIYLVEIPAIRPCLSSLNCMPSSRRSKTAI